MFRKVLIANRGAIACRIIRTLRRMGVASVAVYSEADRHSLHVRQADEAVCIGPAAARAKLSVDRPRCWMPRARPAREAIHPGYGFLSENADFAEACAARGHRLHRPDAGADARLRIEAHGARDRGARAACRCCRERVCWRRCEEALERADADRLSGDAEEHGGRRRNRHAAVPRRGRTARGIRGGGAAEPGEFRHQRAVSGEIRRTRPGTSRCRFSAMARAAWWRSASAIARRSGAIRR